MQLLILPLQINGFHWEKNNDTSFSSSLMDLIWFNKEAKCAETLMKALKIMKWAYTFKKNPFALRLHFKTFLMWSTLPTDRFPHVSAISRDQVQLHLTIYSAGPAGPAMPSCHWQVVFVYRLVILTGALPHDVPFYWRCSYRFLAYS